MVSQFCYTWIAMLPVPFLFYSQQAHAVSLVTVYVASIWNGQ